MLLDLSWMEMAKLIPTLFLNFDVELTDPTAEWREICWYIDSTLDCSVAYLTDLIRWFVKQEGVHVTLRPRSHLIETSKEQVKRTS